MRNDAIMATGRSDYPNQINNVLGFPYIFRGALDVRATTINMEMKIAAARALAELAREDVPDEVAAAYGARPKFGPDYIIPVPFDPRLISSIPPAVAQGGDGHRRRAQADRRHGRLPRSSCARGAIRSPACCSACSSGCAASRKRVVFAEGEEEQVIRAAASFVQQGLGTALLVGREERVRETAQERSASSSASGIEIINARAVARATPPTPPISTSGCSARAFCCATASAWSTRTATTSPPAWWRSATPTPWSPASPAISRSRSRTCAACIDPKPGHRVIGVSLVLARGRTVLVADTAVTEMPDAERHRRDRRRGGAASRAARLRAARSRCSPSRPSAIRRASAPSACRRRCASSTSAASISNTTARWPPTWRSTRSCAQPIRSAACPGPANVLIMPAFHSASISTKMLQELGGATVIGPMLVGLDRSVQIVPARRQGRPASSTWRRSPPITSAAERGARLPRNRGRQFTTPKPLSTKPFSVFFRLTMMEHGHARTLAAMRP